MRTEVLSEQSLAGTSEQPAKVAAQVANVLQEVQRLEAERDQLRARVLQLEAECKQIAKERSILLHALVDATTTDEELDRISKEPGGRTWAEIKADLEKV